jgi:DNA repair protein RadC
MEVLERSPHLSELKLSYKTSKHLKFTDYKILCKDDAYEVVSKLFDPDTIELREEFILMFLNTSKLGFGWCRFATGSKTAVQIDIAQIVAMALLANAHSVIIAHNHPSGNLTPSMSDKHLTKAVLNALHLHGIELLDHLILTRSGYTSLREEMNFNPINVYAL